MTNNKLLRVGDVIEIKEGMEIYADIPEKFAYSNSCSSDITRALVKVSEKLGYIPATVSVVVNKIADVLSRHDYNVPLYELSGLLERYNSDKSIKEVLDTSSFVGEYLVYKATEDGGSHVHGYSGGWHVFARKVNEPPVKIDFYQSGCFTAMMSPDEISPIRHEKTIMLECE